ncbi:YlzJ-like family protein [Virgibacillus flavescens]|uniref:YlzJ-like family protein n=1 Tax=Virgibacillus flavescens TaxID=1611422 RepID=UPI003D325331
MILYTPLSEADIFPSQNDNSQRSVIIHQNRSVYVEKNEEGNYQVVQLLSTDPEDFMNAQYQPGSILPTH